MGEENLHRGHRDRVKQRFLKEGLQHFAPHEVVEMLLFFGVPMKDTNELAHILLNHFGSLSALLEAPVAELKKVKGVSDHVAVLIHFIAELTQVYYEDKTSVGTLLNCIEDVGELLMPKFWGRKNETVILLSMDNRRKVLNCSVICEGSVNATQVSLRLILQQALRDNATVVILAHNHPNGHAFPSAEDIETTKTLIRSLKMVDVSLVDHLIFSEEDYISMAQTPSLKPIFPIVL